MNQQLHDYIDDQLKSGISKDSIRQTLLGAGWKAEDVEAEFASFEAKPIAATPPSTTQIGPGIIETNQKPIQERSPAIFTVQSVNKVSGRHPAVKILISGIALFVLFGGSNLGWQYYQRYTIFEETKNAMKDMPQMMAGLSKYSYLFETKILINPDPNAKQSAQLQPKKFSLADLSNLVVNYFNAGKTGESNMYLAQAQSSDSWLIPKSLINVGLDLRVSGSYANIASHRNFSLLFDFTAEQRKGLISGLSFEIRRVGDTNYFRVVQLPAELVPVINSSIPSLNLITVMGKWFSINDKTLSDLHIFPPTPTTASNDSSTTDINKRRQDLIKNSDLFEIKNAFLDISVPGNSYVADIDLKPDNLKKFLKDSIQLNQDRATTKQEELGIDSSVEKLAGAKITIWTGAKDHYLQKAELMSSSTAQGNIVSLDSILGFSNFETAQINEPTQAIAFDDELKNILASYTRSGLAITAPNSQYSNAFLNDAAQVKLTWGSGKYQDALVKAKQLLSEAKTNQEKAIAHYWIGLSYYKLADSKEAEKEELLAVSLDPTYSGPNVTLAAINLDRQDCKKAFAYASKAVELDPKYAWAHNDLGLAYLCLGNRQAGIEELKKAVSLDPETYVFQDNLNRVLQQKYGG